MIGQLVHVLYVLHHSLQPAGWRTAHHVVQVYALSGDPFELFCQALFLDPRSPRVVMIRGPAGGAASLSAGRASGA